MNNIINGRNIIEDEIINKNNEINKIGNEEGKTMIVVLTYRKNKKMLLLGNCTTLK